MKTVTYKNNYTHYHRAYQHPPFLLLQADAFPKKNK